MTDVFALRDLLTTLAVIVILALATALVGPHFVDWNAHRGQVEAALSEALGTPVTTEGRIWVRLLPSPVLSLDGVSLGAESGPGVTAYGIKVEFAVAPLLKGQFHISQASLEQPVVTLALSPEGEWTLPRLRLATIPGGGPTEVAVERLEIENGTIRLLDNDGRREHRLDNLSGVISSVGLAGPWTVEGLLDGRRLRISTGEIDGENKLRVKLLLGEEEAGRVEADGVLSLTARAGRVSPAFAGKLSAAKRLATAGQDGTPVVASATAAVTIAGRALKAESIEVEAGPQGQTIKLSGSGAIDLGPDPQGEIAFAVRRISLDEVRDRLGLTLGDVLGSVDAAGALPLPISLKLSSASLVLGDEEATNVEMAFKLGGGRIGIERFAARLPGETSLAFNGSSAVNEPQDLMGHVSLKSAAPPRLALALLRSGLPQPRAEALARLPGLSLEGDVVLSSTIVAARNLRLAAGAATVTGTFRYSSPENGERGRFDAQVAADGLDLAALPDLDTIYPALGGLDLGLLIDARRVRFGEGADAGRVRAKLTTSGDAITLEALDVADLAGARVTAAGRIGPGGEGRIEGRVEAQRAAPVLALLGKFWASEAPAFVPSGFENGPLRLSLSATAATAPVMRQMTIAIDGAMAEATLKGVVMLGERGALASGDVAVTAPSAAPFLDRLGFPAAPGTAPSGPVSLALTIAPRPAGQRALTLAGELSGLTVKTQTPVVIGAAGALLQEPARFALAAADAGPFARALGLNLEPGRTLPLTATVTIVDEAEGWRVAVDGRAGTTPLAGELGLSPDGRIIDGQLGFDHISLPVLAALTALGPTPAARPGALWPAARFGAAPAVPLGGEITLTGRTLDLGMGPPAGDVRLRIAPVADGVGLTLAQGRFAGGAMTGTLALKRLGGSASLSADVNLDSVHIEALSPGSALAGEISGFLRFGGAGESVASIVANLSGGGTLKGSDMRLQRLDPAALDRVANAAVDNPAALDQRRLNGLVAEGLDQAAFSATAMEVPITVTGGVVRASPVAAEGAGSAFRGALSLDLKTLTLDASGTLTSRGTPPGWLGLAPQIAVAWRGPAAGPRRDIETGPLASGLAALQLTKELERIEAFETDVRERAAQNRRLKAERDMRDVEARAAEEARRQLAEEARVAEETRRQDEVRRRAEAEAEAKARAAAEAEAKARAAADARAAAEVRAAEARAADDARRRPAEETRRRLEAERQRAESERLREIIERSMPQTATPAQSPSRPSLLPLDISPSAQQPTGAAR